VLPAPPAFPTDALCSVPYIRLLSTLISSRAPLLPLLARSNNHPQIGLRILESLSDELDFSAERHRWEEHALRTMGTDGGGMRTGAFKMFSVAKQGGASESATVPFGHLGGDGWCLSYYFPWASNADVPRRIWEDISRPLLDTFEAFDHPPHQPCYRGHDGAEARSAGGTIGSSEPNSCCFNLNIPVSAWAASLLPAMAQAGDSVAFERVRRWLERHYRSVSHTEAGGAVIRLAESIEWSIGNTMAYLLGLSLRQGASFRELVQAPRPREYFAGPLLEEASCATCHVDVFRCWREDGPVSSLLHVGLCFPKAMGPNQLPVVQKTVALRLHNVAHVTKVICDDESKDASGVGSKIPCNFEQGVLEVRVRSVSGSVGITVTCEPLKKSSCS
jgi:hypothetical protein